MRTLALSIAIVAFAACADVEVMRYSATTYAPTNEAQVLTAAPKDPFEVIAIMNTYADSDAIIRLRKKAAEIGADAIILGPPRTESSYVPTYQMSPQVENTELIDCQAIRFLPAAAPAPAPQAVPQVQPPEGATP